MPVTMEPCEDGHVLRLIIADPWTATDVLSIYPAASDYLDKAPHTVHSLVRIDAQHVPPGLLCLCEEPPGLVHPNSGQSAVVSPGPVLRAIAEVIFKIVHYDRGKFFDTEEEALTYLRQSIAHEAGEGQRSGA